MSESCEHLDTLCNVVTVILDELDALDEIGPTFKEDNEDPAVREAHFVLRGRRFMCNDILKALGRDRSEFEEARIVG